MKYRCNVCGQIVGRDSRKQWLKSYCQNMNKQARLYRMRSMRKKKKGRKCGY